MPFGDIIINDFSIGSMNAHDPSVVNLLGFKIHEDIMNPYGPVADCRLIDHSDALGQYNINGSEDVNINFTVDQFGGQCSFKLTGHENKNLNDRSEVADRGVASGGSMHHKQFDLRFCAPEFVAAHGNPVSKTYNTQCSDIIKDIVQNYFKSDKQVETPDTTEAKKRMMAHNEHPLDFMKKVIDESVSTQNKSSFYLLYATRNGGNETYRYETVENMFKRDTGLVYKQSVTNSFEGSSEQDKYYSVMKFKAPNSFYRPARPLFKAVQKTYNFGTGKIHAPNYEQQQFTVLGSPIFSQPPKNVNEVTVRTINDPNNNKDKQRVSTARTNRTQFASHLAQNSAKARVPGNPNITVGSVITMEIPNKSEQQGGNEKQLNNKFLVTAIDHKILPLGSTPRYVMDLTLVKGGFDEGGGGNG